MSGTHDEEDARWGYSTEIGLDGWPVDPRHPANRTNNETTEEWRQRRFREDTDACRRAFDAGSYPALMDMVLICRVENQPLPEWASREVFKALLESFRNAPAKGKGRVGNPNAAFLQNWIHFVRWDTVAELLRRPEVLKDMGRRPSKASAYAVASAALAGTTAQGEPLTMKKSHAIVETATRKGKGSRYRIPVSRELRAAVMPASKPDTKSR